ncbi:MAG: DUF1552 domain-containing protein, partial [Myxococcota bacterium]
MKRRHFLAGSAAAAAFLGQRPDRIRQANAQVGQGPTRFLAIRTPHGADRDYWIPRQGSGAEPASEDEPLSGLSFDYENSMLTPLMPWRDQITVLDGLDSKCTKEGTRGGRTAHGHNEQGSMLTGAQPPANREGYYDNHPSLDFYLHGLLGAPVLITASVAGAGTWKCMSYDQTGSPRSPEPNPNTVFRQTFPEDFGSGDPMIDYTAGENRIVDYGDAALAALETRLQGVEQQKIDAHREAMTRLAANPIAGCTTMGTDLPGVDGNVGSYENVREIARAQAAVIAQAFACGRSRCATLQILNDFPNFYTDVPDVVASGAAGLYGGGFRFHENLVHDYWQASGSRLDTLRRGYCAGQRWATGHFAAVLDELSQVLDPQDPGGGTILD